MFPEQIGVLNHGALERLENDAALFQLIRNDVALDKLVTREDHPTSVPLRVRANMLENSCALILR